ncbi:Asparagine synthetase [glutamine-hydrolyzing] 1 [Halotydeus destructor]|nr:Asparagine synthetase [glutamine-hydrolyzing] 1 [Halotydeus destructor]
MCGILCILRAKGDPTEVRRRTLALSAKLRHRGPDWNGICVQQRQPTASGKSQGLNVLAHERLAIVDPETGAQPLYDHDRKVALAVNGEIWNHQELREEFKEYPFQTHSDCEPIIPLYKKYGDDFVKRLDGIFAFVISDEANDEYLAARDPIGVMSFYIGWGNDGSVWFSSELKALADDCTQYQEFPAGHYWSSKTNEFVRWYKPDWLDRHIPNSPLDLTKLRAVLEKSVIKRLMTDVPYGVLLSGGLDSSLVASIVARHAMTVEAWPRVHTFSVGLDNAPDLQAARQVSEFLGTIHHEFNYTIQEGLDALSDVIYHIETYDVTTVRASTPMFLLARKIRAMGVKMVLSGEGADEVFGGYLYFHKAPSKEAFHVETCDKIALLSKYDCLRANKSTAAWGVESREPFLDRDLLDLAMSIDPKEKMIDKQNGRMEKWILRKAFDDKEKPFLPDNVLWRQKEQFSDGVGYGWIDALKELAEKEVTDGQLASANYRFPYNTPLTKEAYYYRCLFVAHFPQEVAARTVPGGPSIACSTPAAIEWDLAWKNQADPSGRAVSGVHVTGTAT